VKGQPNVSMHDERSRGAGRPFRRLARLVVTLVLTAAAGPAEGQDAAGWQPPPPDEFDWVQLDSGEWLKGEIIELHHDDLLFDSDELDLQRIDWEDVRWLRSAKPMRVSFAGHLETGLIVVDQETIRVVGEGEQEFARDDVVTVARQEVRELDRWSARAGLGANLRSGNTDQYELFGTAEVVRRTVKDRLTLKLDGSVNRTDGVVVADNTRVAGGWGHSISKRLGWAPAFAEWFRDPFANLAHRFTLGMGLRFTLADTSDRTWEATAGLGYQASRFVEVPPSAASSAKTPALIVGLNVEEELTGWVDFNVDYRAYIVQSDSGRYAHHFVSGLEIELTSVLDLDLTLTWDRIQEPQPDAEGVVPKKDDLRLAVLFELDF